MAASTQPNPRQLLEDADSLTSRLPKVSLWTTFTIHNSARGTPGTAESVVFVQCDIDRMKQVAHLVVNEGHAHTSNLIEIFYVGDTQYVKDDETWRRVRIQPEILEALFGRSGTLELMNIGYLRRRDLRTADSARRKGTVTLMASIPGKELTDAMPVAAADAIHDTFEDASVELDIDETTKLISGFRAQSAGSRGAATDGIDHHTQTDVKVRPLAPDFEINLPRTLAAAAPAPAAGVQSLALASPSATAASCWCTGCAACATCVACAACISCLACLFPPLLAPVTATAAGTAIATATGVATSASIGVATAIQKG